MIYKESLGGNVAVKSAASLLRQGKDGDGLMPAIRVELL
jgi:hypothetical protein